ncbi:MAG: phytoene desaturase [Gammaproteobacteria bacterium]|nr:phytoene desaturase [Gammaproteobacteria bacterium]
MTNSARLPVAVIGAGFGGLAAAIRLQASGVPTLVLEKRDRPGGRAYVFEDEGFTFDAGPTVITAPECIEELFQLAQRPMADYLEFVQLDPMYRLSWEDGYTLDYTADLERMNAQIAAHSPADVDGYRRFLEYSEAVFQEGYVKLAAVPFLDMWSMVRAGPQLARLQSWRSVYSIVAKYIKDPQLRQAFSYHTLLVGGNPFTSSSIYALIHALERRWGVLFPRGGTGALVQALARLYRDLGGDLRVDCPVDRIDTNSGRVSGVCLESGERIPVSGIVSNADVVHTYEKLLRDESLLDRKRRSLARKRYSMSLFVVYFGLRRQHPQLAHHTVLFGPRYKELLDDIFERGVLADDFSLYLHAPSVTDPNLAPPGCSAYYVLAPVPNFANGQIDWSTEAPRFRDRILEYVEKRCIPGLREDLVTSRMFTPQDFVTELNAHQGSAFSLQPTLTQSAYFRVHNRDARIGGLYFVGAGTHPGAGVPGVVNSAKATAGLVLQDQGAA